MGQKPQNHRTLTRRGFGEDRYEAPMQLSVRHPNKKKQERYGWTYNSSLIVRCESEIIALEVVGKVIYVLLVKRRVGHQVRWGRGSQGVISPWGREGGVGEWVKRVVPPDVVRDRICHYHVFESAGGDLEIVVGVTPAANAGARIIEKFGVEEVGGV